MQPFASAWVGRVAAAIVIAIAAASTVQANDQVLRTGQPVLGAEQQNCQSSFLEDGVRALCTILPGASCPLIQSSCRTYERQLFMGTGLGAVRSDRAQWNGMGGSGAPIADSLICMMRDLSPQLRGPIRSQVAFNLGIGTLRATQEIGFKSFRRVNPVLEAYRKITLDLPVVGKADAVTQSLTLTKRTYGHSGNKPVAGNREVHSSYAINVATEYKAKDIVIRTPSFPVTTPIGVFTVSPQFSYRTRGKVVAAPYSTPYADIPNFLGGTNTVRFYDMFGLNAGLEQTTKHVIYQNMDRNRTGWLSQLGLGTRGTIADSSVWSASPAPPVMRPDTDPTKARSPDEAEPSVRVEARATIKYPDNPLDFLPSWVNKIPFLRPPEAYVLVTPKVEAGVGGQFSLGAGEGSDHWQNQEFRFLSSRFSSSAIVSGLRVAGSFNIDVTLRLLVKANFPWPIGTRTFVDVNKTIPVPLYGDHKTGAIVVAGAWSTGNETPETLDYMKTMHGVEMQGAASTAAYIQQCYAPGFQPAVAQPPATPPAPGKPEDLFSDDVLWPCNICINTTGVDYDGRQNPDWRDPVHIPPHQERLLPSIDQSQWKCDGTWKNGCMDMCRFNKASGQMTIARRPALIASTLPHGSPNRAFFEQCEKDAPVVR